MKVQTNTKPLRIEQWVKLRFPELPKRHIREAIDQGLVLDGQNRHLLVKGDRRTSDDSINYDGLRAHLATLSKGQRIEIPILFETDDYWVIDKPQGVPSQSISLFDQNTVSQWALFQNSAVRIEFANGHCAPHRLDTGTSGCLVVAKNQRSFTQWRNRFSQKKIRKKYLAWCTGEPGLDTFRVETPIGHHLTQPSKMIAIGDGRTYRPPVMKAETSFTVLLRKKNAFLCEAQCTTGATHQIRVHLASLGFPLIGDTLYGGVDWESPYHLLRAYSLETDELSVLAPTDGFKALLP